MSVCAVSVAVRTSKCPGRPLHQKGGKRHQLFAHSIAHHNKTQRARTRPWSLPRERLLEERRRVPPPLLPRTLSHSTIFRKSRLSPAAAAAMPAARTPPIDPMLARLGLADKFPRTADPMDALEPKLRPGTSGTAALLPIAGATPPLPPAGPSGISRSRNRWTSFDECNL